jgi:hypothetical protein
VSKLEYKGVLNKNISPNYGEQHIQNGRLSVLWDDSQGSSSSLQDKEELFVLQFVSLGGTYRDVNITGEITSAKAFDKNLASRTVNANWSELDKEDILHATQLYPNPFKESVSIEFYSEEIAVASILIMDELGREVCRFTATVSKGLNKVVWDGRDGNHVEQAKGLYIIDLSMPSGLAKMKVVKQ